MSTVETFNALYREHAERVRAIAARRVRLDDRDLIEDLTQEAFLRLWLYLESGHTIANPAGLLGTLVHRAAIDHYRLARSTRERATDLTDPLAGRIVPASPSAEDVALMHAEVEALLASASLAVAR